MTLYHTLTDPPRVCWACVDDIVDAPDEPMGEHDPEVAGAEDGEPYCVCGHSLIESREDRYVLTITSDQTEPPTERFRDALAEMLGRALDAGDITAVVTVEPMPDPDRPCTFGEESGDPCGDGPDAHDWHHDGTHPYQR